MNSFNVDAKYLSNLYEKTGNLIYGYEANESATDSSKSAGTAPASSDYSKAYAKNDFAAPTYSVATGPFSETKVLSTPFVVYSAMKLAAQLFEGFLSFMEGSAEASEGTAKASAVAEKPAKPHRDPFSSIDCFGDKVY